ncbi:GGDEF domain-containing protein [Cyanobium gracile]|uniref:GGDEF domain-containing protein n=1 Tax=Cyanobium gracile TaxID=59930 RepID=UPI0005BBD668|nr:GGDEF domain-containing protein [Cyanobium gracile]
MPALDLGQNGIRVQAQVLRFDHEHIQDHVGKLPAGDQRVQGRVAHHGHHRPLPPDHLHEHLLREARLSEDLSAMGERFRQSNEQLRRLSSTDLLTGARNRSEPERGLKLTSQRASDCAVPLSCLAFAVQGLRPINTVLGRQTGDEVLHRLNASVRPLLHANDELFRIGGSEVLALLWDQPLEGGAACWRPPTPVVKPCCRGWSWP